MGRHTRIRLTKKLGDDLRSEYDLTQLKGVRGKYFQRATADPIAHLADMGSAPGLNYDNIGDLLEPLEGPLHR